MTCLSDIKSGDKIYLALGSLVTRCEVVGFRSYYTELRTGDRRFRSVPYHKGAFYGFGYDVEGTRHLFLTSLWHYPLAVCLEAIRRRIPRKVSRFIGLEK